MWPTLYKFLAEANPALVSSLKNEEYTVSSNCQNVLGQLISQKSKTIALSQDHTLNCPKCSQAMKWLEHASDFYKGSKQSPTNYAICDQCGAREIKEALHCYKCEYDICMACVLKSQ